MDLKNLQCFIAAAEQLNFSRAAQSLYISQPSLSIRINNLEDELGVKLFERTHQHVYLTEEGAALLPSAREILEKINSLPDIVKNVKPDQNLPTSLKIGIDAIEDRSFAPIDESFSAFQRVYPEIEMQVVDVEKKDYEHKLLRNELDFCLMVLQKNDIINPMFLSFPLLTEKVVMVTSCADDIPDEEVMRTRELYLLYDGERGEQWNDQYLKFFRTYTQNVRARYFENVSLLRINLCRGKGATFFPQAFAETLSIPNRRIIPVELPQSEVILTLLWNKYNINPAIQFMANEFESRKDLK